jgi:signal transduction histidine kinase
VLGIRVTQKFTRAEEREREAFAVLEKRNRELDAFAGRVAHDFRAPLTSVKMAADLLGLPTPDVAKSSAVIQRGVRRMSAMIDDLLQLSQIEGAVRSDVCDPASVANAIRDDMAERLAVEGATLQLAVEAARVNCREGLFQQVLSNLAENALKYRRPDVKPEIQISGRVAANQYELCVTDNGIGMSANEAARVFDPLFRARRLREVPGTGLGLSIVKRIVEASGGTASVESKLGQGSTFTIRLSLEATG